MEDLPAMTQAAVNLYDFDYTIYDGDCSLDFYRFCLRQKPLLLAYLPYQILHFALYAMKLQSRTSFKSKFFVFLCGVDDVAGSVEQFWNCHYVKIKKWYLVRDHASDVIISASPDFLLRTAFSKLKAHTLIATDMSPRTGLITGMNCRGDEKVKRFKKELGSSDVAEAYSDHRSDMPMLSLAKKSFFVIGENIFSIQDYKNTTKFKVLLSKLRRD